MKNKKISFTYQATDANGKVHKGQICATSYKMAKIILRHRDLKVVKLSKSSRNLLFLNHKVKNNEITYFLRQLATLIKSGVSIIESLKLCLDSTYNITFKIILSDVVENVSSGLTLSLALTKHLKYFDQLLIGLVEAGEESGSLDIMLDRIATYKERTNEIISRVKKALYYPIIIIVISIAITILLLIKVIPTFKDLFASYNADLPKLTQLILSFASFIKSNFSLLSFISLSCLIFLFYIFKKSQKFKFFIQKLSLKIPVLGQIIVKGTISKIARTLATTFKAGLPLIDSLDYAAKSTGYIIYKQALLKIKNEASNGINISQATFEAKVFPNMVVQMIAIGEESGSFDKMLTKIADIYENEVTNSVDGLTTLIEPIIMITLGTIIGTLILAIYLPIFKMGSLI